MYIFQKNLDSVTEDFDLQMDNDVFRICFWIGVLILKSLHAPC